MFHWRLSDWIFALLAGMLVFSAWIGFVLNRGGDGSLHSYGGDFYQFYMAGTMVNRGEVDRLYDQTYFRDLQRPEREQPLYSLYPPMMALAMAPVARLPYARALDLWWTLQAASFLVSGWMIYRRLPLSRAWRINALVALAGLLPVWIAIGIGHLAPLLLAVLLGGFCLHERGRYGWAGLLLAALAVKPQLLTGLVLWLLVRRDWRTLAGMAAGLAGQAAAVSLCLGPGVFFDFLHALPTIAAVTRAFRYSPIFEQSLSGIVSNLLEAGGCGACARLLPMLLTQILTAGLAAVLLCRLVWSVRPWQARALPAYARSYEYACAGLFILLFPPYLLVYDLTLLAVPLLFLWSSPAWRMGVLLYATATVLAAACYLGLGFSVTGLVALSTMCELTLAMEPLRSTPATAALRC